jgi:hypothetical protein
VAPEQNRQVCQIGVDAAGLIGIKDPFVARRTISLFNDSRLACMSLNHAGIISTIDTLKFGIGRITFLQMTRAGGPVGQSDSPEQNRPIPHRLRGARTLA